VRTYDSVPKIRWLLMPKLFIQGGQDEVIPPTLGQKLFAAAQSPKSFWVIEGAGHNDLLEKTGIAYLERLKLFYASLPVAIAPTNRKRERF